MGVRVEVRGGEAVRSALRRLRQKLEVLRRRQFIKGKRGDYYVKLCETRRRLEYEARYWKKGCRRPKN
jgi:ribosomal protein S21